MKVRMFGMAAVIGAVVMIWLSLAGVVHAEDRILTVDVPFEFYIGDTLLPAGTYTVTTIGIDRTSVIRLADGKGHSSVIMTGATENRGNPLKSHLIFNRYGTTNFLSEVRWMGAANARVVPMSPRETQVARDMAKEQVAAAPRK